MGTPVPARDLRQVITASSLGTLFEWYDFFLYGTLAASGIIGSVFFPSGEGQLQTLLAWAGFAVGFGFRPLGAVIFGYLGDRFGRKHTFIVTIVLMGAATAGVGLVPSYAAIGWLAPALIVLLRIVQGLALGGEYGGAAIYVSEHSPPGKRGFYTSFIQACVGAGFFLSLLVVLLCKWFMGTDTWHAWGWRVPFLLSVILLAISLWMRMRLSESPVFKAMKAAGQTAKNPLRESFTYPGNIRRLVLALFGIAAGFTVIWFTAMFSTLGFLRNAMHVDETVAQILVGTSAALGLFWFVFFGRLSDRIGRKRLIVTGYVLTLLLLFPLFWLIRSAAGPPLNDGVPSAGNLAIIFLAIMALTALSGATYGPVAALLTELFPPRIRYSSMSIPYHFGTGYFGGLLPLVEGYIVTRTGNPISGLWYSWCVVAMALVVTLLLLREDELHVGEN